jgi:phosphogluconate dehydratase
MVFNGQEDLLKAFDEGKLEKDFIAVVRFQGPKANGMPELHKLTPPLSVIQNMGFTVGIVTDGRMSGASGKIPAAIHLSPEGAAGGAISKIREGDMIRLNATVGSLNVLVDEESGLKGKHRRWPILKKLIMVTGWDESFLPVCEITYCQQKRVPSHG